MTRHRSGRPEPARPKNPEPERAEAAGDDDPAETTRTPLRTHGVGTDAADGGAGSTAPTPDGVPDAEARAAPDAVSCVGLVHAFGEMTAVDGLDLAVRDGEVFGLLGPNGAGKTTALRCITTLLPVPPGKVRVFGHDSTTGSWPWPRLSVSVRFVAAGPAGQVRARARPRPGRALPEAVGNGR